MQSFPKPVTIRLKGKQLEQLRRDVWERDDGLCQKCGKYVPYGTPPHHIVFKSQGGGDTLDNLITLCNNPCHYKIHHGGK